MLVSRMVSFEGGCRSEDNRRHFDRASCQGPTCERRRHHRDGSHRPAARGRFRGLRAAASASRQGPLLASGRRVQGRSVIAADTSTWIAFFQGDAGRDVELLDRALGDRQVMMPPPVLTELLSDPQLPSHVRGLLDELPLLQIADGFWARAGELRAAVLRRQRKARLGDALIAQSCVDGGVPLITRDQDFRAFAAAAGLDLVVDAPR